MVLLVMQHVTMLVNFLVILKFSSNSEMKILSSSQSTINKQNYLPVLQTPHTIY